MLGSHKTESNSSNMWIVGVCKYTIDYNSEREQQQQQKCPAEKGMRLNITKYLQ